MMDHPALIHSLLEDAFFPLPKQETAALLDPRGCADRACLFLNALEFSLGDNPVPFKTFVINDDRHLATLNRIVRHVGKCKAEMVRGRSVDLFVTEFFRSYDVLARKFRKTGIPVCTLLVAALDGAIWRMRPRKRHRILVAPAIMPDE